MNFEKLESRAKAMSDEMLAKSLAMVKSREFKTGTIGGDMLLLSVLMAEMRNRAKA